MPAAKVKLIATGVVVTAVVGFIGSGDGADVGARMIRARLTATTLQINRATAGDDSIEEIAWQVVHLKEGSVMQTGATNVNGTTSATAALSTVDTSRVVAFASTQEGGGSTDYVSDDILGTGQARFAVTSSTQLTITRGTSNGNATFSWFVIQFASG